MQRSDAVGQRRLQQVARIHRPAGGGAGADQRVDLVDEEDGVLLFLEPVEHLLDALLEVAAVARAGDQRAEVERIDLGGLEDVGHLALMDPQRQPLGERRLADARLADQQRVVLAPPAQHLDHPLELERPADQRIDLPGRGAGDQVRGDTPRADPSTAARRRRRPAAAPRPPLGPWAIVRSRISRSIALRLEEVRRMAVLLLQQEHQQAAAVDLLGTRRGRMQHGVLDDAVKAERRLRLDRRRCRQRRERLAEHVVQLPPQRLEVGAAGRQHPPPLRLVGDRQQQVLEADRVVAPIGRHAEGALDGFQRLGCEGNRRLAHCISTRGG